MPDDTPPYPRLHHVDFTFAPQPWACRFDVDGRPLMVSKWRFSGDAMQDCTEAELSVDLGKRKLHCRGHFVPDEGTFADWPAETEHFEDIKPDLHHWQKMQAVLYKVRRLATEQTAAEGLRELLPDIDVALGEGQ